VPTPGQHPPNASLPPNDPADAASTTAGEAHGVVARMLASGSLVTRLVIRLETSGAACGAE